MNTFSTDTLKFLAELKDNNNREWFQTNKPRYVALVREPALDFIESMQPLLFGLSEHFLAIPKISGGSLMRVYRDIRFSKDKTPYKTHIGIHFRHEYGKDVHAPGYYVHISSDDMFLGAGIWHPDSVGLGKIRERIVEQSDLWQQIRDDVRFKADFELRGDTLKRPPRGYDNQHRHIEDLKRKDFIAAHTLDAKQVSANDLKEQIADKFAGVAPLMSFLCKSLALPF